MQSIGYFYILTNAHHTVLYCGATDDLYRRVQEHKNGTYSNSFSLGTTLINWSILNPFL